jgi:hypothetical protein
VACVVTAPDALPWFLGRGRVAFFREGGPRCYVFADAHAHAEGACGKFHPAPDAERRGGELGELGGLLAGLAEAGGGVVVSRAFWAGEGERWPDRCGVCCYYFGPWAREHQL